MFTRFRTWLPRFVVAQPDFATGLRNRTLQSNFAIELLNRTLQSSFATKHHNRTPQSNPALSSGTVLDLLKQFGPYRKRKYSPVWMHLPKCFLVKSKNCLELWAPPTHGGNQSAYGRSSTPKFAVCALGVDWVRLAAVSLCVLAGSRCSSIRTARFSNWAAYSRVCNILISRRGRVRPFERSTTRFIRSFVHTRHAVLISEKSFWIKVWLCVIFKFYRSRSIGKVATGC